MQRLCFNDFHDGWTRCPLRVLFLVKPSEVALVEGYCNFFSIMTALGILYIIKSLIKIYNLDLVKYSLV